MTGLRLDPGFEFAAVLRAGHVVVLDVFGSADHAEGLSGFAERRPPVFSD